jgi:hypothetical protein
MDHYCLLTDKAIRSVNMNEKDFSWLTDHGVELHEKYAGKWIAVYDECVIAVGDTAVEVAEEARKVAKDGDYILEALDPIGDHVYGCF